MSTINAANMLGLDYRALAESFNFAGEILDVHAHINTLDAAKTYFDAADRYNVRKVWSMTPLADIEPIQDAFGDRIEFICVPTYAERDKEGTFTTDWLRKIEQFRERGCRQIKFWAAPRGLDFVGDSLRLDSPIRREGMKLAYDLGYRVFMTHVGDPDTWFQTTYADAAKYGTKADQFKPLEAMLDEYHDVTWIGAHMGGWPEDLGFLQGMLDRHANYYLDTSACKWMIRELSKHPAEFFAFCKRNPGRILFGSDIVANDELNSFDQYASRYWALRTLLETDYVGMSPIVDPDLHLVDPSVPEDATAELRGASFDKATLQDVYHDAAKTLYEPVGGAILKA